MALKGEINNEPWNQLMAKKSCGGLTVQSLSTLAICKIAEQRFWAMQHSTWSDGKQLSKIIRTSVIKLMLTDYNLFPSLKNHTLEMEHGNNQC